MVRFFARKRETLSLQLRTVEPSPVRGAAPASGSRQRHASRRGAGRRPAARPAARPHGHPALRRAGIARPDRARGYRQVAYDARGHGESSPAPSYDYPDLVDDLDAVLRDRGLERAVLVGSSMGAATAMAFALAQPERVSALVQITPAFDGEAGHAASAGSELADALEPGGVEAFVEANDPDRSPSAGATRCARPCASGWSATSIWTPWPPRCARCRARCAWDGLEALERLEVPTLVVGSRDDADPLHPLGSPRTTRSTCRTRS